MSWSALSSLVATPFGQLSPRKSESRACYLTNVAADKRSSGCAWLCHALLLNRLQLNFGVRQQLKDPIARQKGAHPPPCGGAPFARTLTLQRRKGGGQMTRVARLMLAALFLPLAGELSAQNADWRKGLDPATGYTAQQSLQFHALYDLATWQIPTDT